MIQLPYPIYTLTRLENGLFFVGGGGGKGRHGIANKMSVVSLSNIGLLAEEHSIDIDDACVSSSCPMAKPTQVWVGIAEECRVYSATKDGLVETKSQSKAQGSESRLSYLQLSGDGNTLATGHEDGTVRILHPSTFKVLQSAVIDPKGVRAIAASPDGTLAAACFGKKCVVYSTKTGQETPLSIQGALKDQNLQFRCLFFEDNQHLLAAVQCGDYTYLVRFEQSAPVTEQKSKGKKTTESTPSWEQVTLVKSIKTPATCLAVSDDQELLALGTPLGGVAVFSRANFRYHGTLPHHHLPTTGVAFSADGYIVSASADGSMAASRPPPKSRRWMLIVSLIVLLLAVLVVTRVATPAPLDKSQ